MLFLLSPVSSLLLPMRHGHPFHFLRDLLISLFLHALDRTHPWISMWILKNHHLCFSFSAFLQRFLPQYKLELESPKNFAVFSELGLEVCVHFVAVYNFLTGLHFKHRLLDNLFRGMKENIHKCRKVRGFLRTHSLCWPLPRFGVVAWFIGTSAIWISCNHWSTKDRWNI